MLDSTQDRPLYRQLTDRLRREVAKRRPGDRIASEPELAQSLGVSRFTVAKAIEALVDEGLVVRRQGKGTFVAVPPLQRTPIHLRSFTESVEASGRNATSELLDFGPLAWRVGLPYDREQALVQIERLRLVDGMPMAIHRSVLVASLVAEVGLTRAKAADPNFSLYRYYEQHGIRIERGIESLSARKPTPAERRYLRLGTDGIVMVVTRRSFGADGRVLDAVDAIHDSRRYAYQALLLRTPQHAVTATQANMEKEGNDVESVTDPEHLGARFWVEHRDPGSSGS
ncbi:MAG TPA: GntR family transcriptional regulator [Magnetospirillaceae bacterium]|jgi:GntR family transcriptional regulator